MKKARQQLILDYINKNNFASTQELSEQFGISRVTVFRDLTELSAESKIELFHGGARSINREDEIRFINEGYKINDDMPKERMAIARYCVDKCIKNGDVIFLGASRISYRVADLLVERQMSLTVVSNTFLICNILLQNPNIDIISIGGKFNGSLAYGELSDEQISKFRFDEAFVGVDGISLDDGCTSIALEFCNAKRAAKNSADKFYVYTTSNVFSTNTRYKFCDLNEVDEILTDSGLSDKTYSLYRNYGVNLTRI